MITKTYRLYTEDVNRDATIALIGKRIKNFTIFPGTCYWHGGKETTLCIEIVDDMQNGGYLLRDIHQTVQLLKLANKQTDVLLTITDTEAHFI